MFEERWPWRRLALAAGVFAALIGYVAWPQLLVYSKAFGLGDGGGGPSLEPWREAFGGALGRRAFWNSVWLSVLSALAAGAAGTGAALLCGRRLFPGRRLAMLASVLPLALPPLIGVMAFSRLFGLAGMVPKALGAATGAPASNFALLDLPAILLVHAYSFSVYFFVFARAGLAGMDGSLDRAARSLGAGPWRRFAKIALPGLAPYLAGAALMTFMVSMGSYSAPYYLSSNRAKHPYLAIEIADRYEGGQFAQAAALAAALSLVCLGVLAALRFGLPGAWSQDAAGGKGVASAAAPEPVRSPWARRALGLGSLLWFLAMAAPLASILLDSLADMKAWNRAGSVLPPGLTLANYAEVFREAFVEPRRHWHPLFVSLAASGLAMCLNVGMALATALLMARGGRAASLGADLLSMAPMALPGTVVAFNLATAFFREGSPWTFGFGLRNTLWILALAYFVRQIPVALRPVSAAMARSDPSAEAAARSLGAGPGRTFVRVVLPRLRGGLLAAALICFVSGAGEFVASVLVSSTAWKPISIHIADSLADSDGLGPASASAALLMAMTAAALMAYAWLTRER